MADILIHALFKSVFIPSGAIYYGVHKTSDFSFGTNQWSDPFIGQGAKLVALAKQNGNNRRLWRVDVIQVGTQKQVDDRLKTILDGLDYDNPKTLNSVEGWRSGRKLTEEHKANIGTAMETAAIGNLNSLGQHGPNIDIDTVPGTKLKHFHNPECTEQKMILCDSDNIPIKDQYKDWVLGKIGKNSYVAKRVDEVRKEAAEDESKED